MDERRLLKIQCYVYVDQYIKHEIKNGQKEARRLEFQFEFYVSLKTSLTI